MSDVRPDETLEEALGRHRINLPGAPKPGHTYGGPRDRRQVMCPECNGGRAREANFFVTIDTDGKGAVWLCHSANRCGWTGSVRLYNAPHLKRAKAPRQIRRPEPERDPQLPQATVDYFGGFGIPPETLEEFQVFRTVRRFPVMDAEGRFVNDDKQPRPCLAYPYFRGGELVNCKYKTIYPNGKKGFVQEWGAERTMFNIDAFESDDIGYIVEGEDDVLAMRQCYRQITTLPDGTPPKKRHEEPEQPYDPEQDDDERYEALRNEPKIHALKKIVLCGDGDAAGARHMEQIARRVGKERCWVVRWPDDCKDAKDTLKKFGPEALFVTVEAAVPYPIDGLADIDDEEIASYRAGLDEKRLTSGIDQIDRHISLADSGKAFTACTGIPGHGKTAFWVALSVLYAETNTDFHTVMFSGEMEVKEIVAAIVSAHAQKPFFDGPSGEGIGTDELVDHLLPWVRAHYTFIEPEDAKGDSPPVDWVIEKALIAIRRTKAKLFIADPWQEMDMCYPDRCSKSLSAWIGDQLRKFRNLGRVERCNVVCIAHPAKMRRDKDGKLPIPEGYDIMDSQQWFSVCRTGMTIYRPGDDSSNEMKIRVWKARYGQFAMRGDTTVRFNRATKRLYPPLTQADIESGRAWGAAAA